MAVLMLAGSARTEEFCQIRTTPEKTTRLKLSEGFKSVKMALIASLKIIEFQFEFNDR